MLFWKTNDSGKIIGDAVSEAASVTGETNKY